MRVLVTGGNGFIGRHVAAALLRASHQVRILTRGGPGGTAGPESGTPLQSEVFRADLRADSDLRPALAGVDAVVHCAASMGGDLEEQRAVTVGGTRRLLAAMDAAKVRRLVGLSTFALYDILAIPEGSLLDERSPLSEDLASRGPYERAKREQEDLIRASGLAWTILRPGIVFGPGRLWSYHLGSRGARKWTCYAGDSVLPLSYVENCADAVAACFSAAASEHAVLNVVDTELPTRRGWVEALARREDPRPAIRDVSWRLLTRLSGIASWIDRRLLFGKAPLPDLLRPASLHARCKPLRYSNEKAREVLGWEPRHDLGVALERSVSKV